MAKCIAGGGVCKKKARYVVGDKIYLCGEHMAYYKNDFKEEKSKKIKS
jgi:hypothetical protein